MMETRPMEPVAAARSRRGGRRRMLPAALALLALAWLAAPHAGARQGARGAPLAGPSEQGAPGRVLAERAHRAMQRAVSWLLARQHDNGSFGAIPGASEQGELGITALVVRALAGLPAPLRTEAVARARERATAWLLAQQRPDGSFGQPGTGLVTYRTAIAIDALVALDAARHAEAIRRARDYLVATQFHTAEVLGPNPEDSPYYGGWGYDRSGVRPEADLSNTAMALDALRRAGLPEDSPVWQRALVFLRRCQNHSETNDLKSDEVVIGQDGGFMYDPGLERRMSVPVPRPDGRVEIPSYASMTYAGLLSMLHARLRRDDPRVQAAWGWIRRNYTLEENRGLGTHEDRSRGQQGLYYYYLMFAKALAAWGEPVIETADGQRRHWAQDLVERLLALQREDGSWYNDEPRWWERDPVLVTAYVLQALEIALPWLERGAGEPGAGGGAER